MSEDLYGQGNDGESGLSVRSVVRVAMSLGLVFGLATVVGSSGSTQPDTAYAASIESGEDQPDTTSTVVDPTIPTSSVPETTTPPETTVPETTTTVPATTGCEPVALLPGTLAAPDRGLSLSSPGDGQQIRVTPDRQAGANLFDIEGMAGADATALYVTLGFTNLPTVPGPVNGTGWLDVTDQLNADGSFSLQDYSANVVGTRRVDVAAVLASGEVRQVTATVVGVTVPDCQ